MKKPPVPPIPKITPDHPSWNKFVDDGIGLQILNPDGELVEIIGEPAEVTAARKRRLAESVKRDGGKKP